LTEDVNTKDYWESRFSSGDWESRRGTLQTRNFAESQVRYLRLGRDFDGSLLDFGCGLGDAIPVYNRCFPKARLFGGDISQSAIERCQEKYGDMATFIRGDAGSMPNVKVIVASNVLEHLTDDIGAARQLLSRCGELYLVVPYREWPLYKEHVHTYDEHYFSLLGECEYQVFASLGWSEYGFRDLWCRIYLKNLGRLLLKRPLHRRSKQIMFHWSP
jgi:SAM-dependent methyltransferase